MTNTNDATAPVLDIDEQMLNVSVFDWIAEPEPTGSYNLVSDYPAAAGTVWIDGAEYEADGFIPVGLTPPF